MFVVGEGSMDIYSAPVSHYISCFTLELFSVIVNIANWHFDRPSFSLPLLKYSKSLLTVTLFVFIADHVHGMLPCNYEDTLTPNHFSLCVTFYKCTSWKFIIDLPQGTKTLLQTCESKEENLAHNVYSYGLRNAVNPNRELLKMITEALQPHSELYLCLLNVNVSH